MSKKRLKSQFQATKVKFLSSNIQIVAHFKPLCSCNQREYMEKWHAHATFGYEQ